MASNGRSLRHALRHWDALGRRVREAKGILLLADYDGTLTPLVAMPEEARLSATMRTLLRRLAGLRGVQVGIVSGRSLRTVRRLVRIPGVFYVGNHGFEIQGAGVQWTHPRAQRAAVHLRRVIGPLRGALADLAGARVEAKGVSLSVHWRQVAASDIPRFRRLIQQALRPWIAQGRVRVTRGKRVVEIRPPIAWDKGCSVAWIVRHLPRPRPEMVLYLGDDRTDEDAFRAVNRLRGVSIVIGRRKTAARWWLASPAEVLELLRRFAEVREMARDQCGHALPLNAPKNAG